MVCKLVVILGFVLASGPCPHHRWHHHRHHWRPGHAHPQHAAIPTSTPVPARTPAPAPAPTEGLQFPGLSGLPIRLFNEVRAQAMKTCRKSPDGDTIRAELLDKGTIASAVAAICRGRHDER